MSEVLPYLGIEPEYTAEELAGADITVPNVVGMTLEDAKTRLSNAGFACTTVGDGPPSPIRPLPAALCAQQRLHHLVPGAEKAGYALHCAQRGGESPPGGK